MREIKDKLSKIWLFPLQNLCLFWCFFYFEHQNVDISPVLSCSMALLYKPSIIVSKQSHMCAGGRLCLALACLAHCLQYTWERENPRTKLFLYAFHQHNTKKSSTIIEEPTESAESFFYCTQPVQSRFFLLPVVCAVLLFKKPLDKKVVWPNTIPVFHGMNSWVVLVWSGREECLWMPGTDCFEWRFSHRNA